MEKVKLVDLGMMKNENREEMRKEKERGGIVRLERVDGGDEV